ncbi:MAG TPA: SAM-dependent methyltransferase [Kofleriaceae bacterium]|nr:SAM-dependent methyltransferase [Kofleriaceae bacterium]
MTDFVFATCLPGIEPAVKLEVARTRPELKFAYSRPGLVTFKSSRGVAPEDPSGSVFARVWGRSIGAAGDPVVAAAQVGGTNADRVHAFARDPDDAAVDLAPWQSLGRGGPASEGELVADVIVSSTDAAWIGVHRHDASRPPQPGGAIPVDVPADAPSRAYAKIEEAIAWAKLPVAAGQVAVEIGAAPGGAVMALARRGLEVWGVDTGELAPHVRALPNVHHLAKKVGALRWEDLPERVDWLLVDVNLAPQVALHEVSRLMPRLRGTVQGAVFTLKMNDWSFVNELPSLVDRIRQMGLPEVGLRHLPSNRREICAVAKR